MLTMVSTLLGGIGLFLLGMHLMTEGLKSAAGEALRDLLARFTGGRFKALVTGAALTALVQSSSATMLATIGLVSAGLLTFPQAVGVIFGVNLGTTSTGWIAALIGLRLRVSLVALPLVGVGAMMRLLSSGRTASLGFALAGFGLIFIGIDTLQAGMQDLSQHVAPDRLPGDTLPARVLLVGLGALMTVVMQSSSAALVTTLAALDAGSIDLAQGAALVIGQNVGTTVKAALAAIGASVPAKRTALAHILFNVVTGFGAFLLLPVLVALLVRAESGGFIDDTSALAVFHTCFNLLGVALFLPVTDRFAQAVARAIPETDPALTRHLDPSVASVPPVAVEATRRAAMQVAEVVAGRLLDLLSARAVPPQNLDLDDAAAAITRARQFLARVHSSPDDRMQYGRHVAVLHALDHLDRLIGAIREVGRTIRFQAAGSTFQAPGFGPRAADAGHRTRSLDTDADVNAVTAELKEELVAVREWLSGGRGEAPVTSLEGLAGRLGERRRAHRRVLLERTAAGLDDPLDVSERLEAMRWLDRVAYHLWRATRYLAQHSILEPVPPSEVAEEPGDTERDEAVSSAVGERT